MFKVFLIVSLIFTISLFGAKNKSSSMLKLKEYNKKLGEFNKKLSAISSDIFKESEAITLITKELSKINRELSRERKRHSVEKKKVERLEKESSLLSLKQKDLRNQVLVTSTRLISISIITEENSETTLDAIIFDEVFDVLSKENVRKLKQFDKGLSNRQSKIDILHNKMDSLKKSINIVEEKKKLFEKKKKSRERMFDRLKSKKTEYKKYLSNIIAKQKRIKAEIERAQAKIAKEKAYRKKSERVKKNSRITTHIGSSYKKEAVKRYLGKKTISPIKNYKLITKFGTYIDPIYKFKIFSSSVILKPDRDNSKVRNIFNGRITLFKDDKTLGKFVMIEHFNGLQTLYAHLDSFSPSIKAGKKIKKGAVIGRVSDRLHFEVMAQNYRIDPLQVIK